MPPTIFLISLVCKAASSLSSLLLRFIDPDAGTVSIDDRPLDGIGRAAWRASVAWVPQRPYLFDGSVADNIRLAPPGASDEAVLAAGVKWTGATVHFVDEQYDHGPIILQDVVPVREDDDADSLAERVQAAERRMVPEAIRLFAEGRLEIRGQRVHIVVARRMGPA